MLPISIVGIFGIGLFLKKNFKGHLFIVLLFVFTLLWRAASAQKIFFSSRYLITLHISLIFSFVYVLLYYTRRFKQGLYLLSIVFFVVLYQTFKSFISYNNIYVQDLRNCIEQLTDACTNNSIAIEEKEYNRLRKDNTSCIKIDNIKTTRELRSFLESYKTWEHPIYFISRVNLDSPDSEVEGLRKTFLVRKILRFNTNKKLKALFVYSYIPHDDKDKFPKAKLRDENRIINGNFELIEQDSVVKKTFNKWISDGAYFYNLNNIKLPQSQHLLPISWNLKKNMNYPIVYLDNNNPIEGQYSLHVLYNKIGTDYPLFFLNKFKADNGFLLFRLRSFNANTKIKMIRVDYDEKGKWINAPMEYYLYMSDLNEHQYILHFEKNVFLAPLTMFRFIVRDAEFCVDDIRFVPEENTTTKQE